MAEIFDVCDANDNVIGQATREQTHAEGLLHRAVHIWVFNSRKEVLIHLRTPTKDEYPDCYTSSASGHVDSGETYEVAAHRELQEELGLKGDLKYITKLPAGPETANEHTVLYALHTDEVPQPDPVEIASIEYHPFSKLAQNVARSPEKYTPPFRELVQWWQKNA